MRQHMRLADPVDALRAYFAYIISSMSEPVRAALRALLDGLADVLEARLSQPDARKRLALPPEDAARLLVFFTRGNVVMERIYNGPEALQATVDSMIQVLFKR